MLANFVLFTRIEACVINESCGEEKGIRDRVNKEYECVSMACQSNKAPGKQTHDVLDVLFSYLKCHK